MLAGYLQTVRGSLRSRGAPTSLDHCQRSDLVVGTAAVTPSWVMWESVLWCYFFLFFSNSASDCGSANEHLPGVVAVLYKSGGFYEIAPLISFVALKASLPGLVPGGDTQNPALSTNPRASTPTDALIRASSDSVPPRAPSPGSLMAKRGFYWPCGRLSAF